MANLVDYFYGLTEKTKVIVTLAAFGSLDYDQIRRIRKNELLKLLEPLVSFESSIASSLNNFIASAPSDAPVFKYDGGRLYSARDIEKFIIAWHEKAGIEYTGYEDFARLFEDRHVTRNN